MKYGKYKITLSIGFVGANREDELDLAEYFDREVWDAMSESEQENEFIEIRNEILGEYIEYSYKQVK